MWVSKISFNCKKALLGEMSIKHGVSVIGYPLSFSYEKKWIIVHIVGTVFGEENNKKQFFKDLKKSNRVIDFEINGDFLIGIIKESIVTKTFYSKNIFHLAPIVISGGIETMTLGAFEKKNLTNAINVFEELHNAKVSYIQQKKVRNISIVKEHPDLTEKQRDAMSLAVKNGYYDYPRKISLESLAKLSSLSFSTFHAHLRKAEHKLMPFFFNTDL